MHKFLCVTSELMLLTQNDTLYVPIFAAYNILSPCHSRKLCSLRLQQFLWNVIQNRM